MTTSLNRRYFLEVTVAALAATVTGTISARPAGAARRRPVKHKVEIGDFRYVPGNPEVRPGDIITWINRDIVPHTATARDGSWGTGTIKAGETGSLLVTADMSMNYICQFHPGMTAQLKILLGQ